MSVEEEHDDLFPADCRLFSDSFSEERAYRFSGQELRICQEFSASLGVAAPVWEAALCLCRYFEEQQFDFAGRRVIELGSGTGIVGILAARLGAAVTLTDLPHALPQLQRNVSANQPSPCWPHPPSVRALSWGLDHAHFPSDWDLVLGADIVYARDTYPLLLATLRHLCQQGAVLYLASELRQEHGTPEFLTELLPGSFHTELLHHDDQLNISIYRGTLRGAGTLRERDGALGH
ncbi:EEF1A lysine methyltransferase 3 [Lepisosteus oculatus]|nr:PREDICTED: protein-lysine methyltransferase METTL21B [Lepisosteus oculatus]